MYVFIAAGAILLLFLGFSFLSSRKHYYFILMVDFKTLNFISIDFDYFLSLHSHLNTGKGSKKPAYKKAVETGTANDDVDYEWIPRSALRTPGNLIGYAINLTKDIAM